IIPHRLASRLAASRAEPSRPITTRTSAGLVDASTVRAGRSVHSGRSSLGGAIPSAMILLRGSSLGGGLRHPEHLSGLKNNLVKLIVAESFPHHRCYLSSAASPKNNPRCVVPRPCFECDGNLSCRVFDVGSRNGQGRSPLLVLFITAIGTVIGVVGGLGNELVPPRVVSKRVSHYRSPSPGL